MTSHTGRPKKMRWRVLSYLMRTTGRSSDGIALGYTHGFDSGQMLDYVYENRAGGRYLIGKLADRSYLNAIGWRGIRSRKELLKAILLTMVQERREAGLPSTILDIASGPGRYLLETCQALSGTGSIEDVTVIGRDLDPVGLELGRQRAGSLGFTGIRYETGDACDPASLATVEPGPDIVVASGLYELLDPQQIQRSMRGVHGILPTGGRFVFTTQVNHPQLELIANVLTNRNGDPWVMECRSLAQTEGWAREAGFEVLSSRMEPVGLYGITVCEKRTERPAS